MPLGGLFFDNLTILVYTIAVAVWGAVAQLGERYNRTVEVRGSNPLSSTSQPYQHSTTDSWGCSAAGSASEWHSEGQGFESPQLHQEGFWQAPFVLDEGGLLRKETKRNSTHG